MIEVEYIDLNEIVEADNNPKDHDLGVIYQSINRFGFNNPIILNDANGKLLVGHGRLQALKLIRDAGEDAPERILVEDGIWKVPVIKGVNIDNPAEAQAYLLADNRLTELGGWKNMDLIESLNEILEETGDLDGTGYDLEDVDSILKSLENNSDMFEEDASTTETAESLDETEVSIAVGRYKFKVDAEEFYEWEEMVKSSSGAQDVVGISLWIKENLGLN
jgi:hypothetical protein